MDMKFLVILYLIIFVRQFCVMTDDQNSAKISGGYIGDRSLYGKYVASIRHSWYELQQFGTGFFCGGTIISKTTVITAAHCLHKISGQYKVHFPIHVVVGTKFLYTKEGNTQIFGVKKLLLHPDFDPVIISNDIAIVALNKSIRTDGTTVDIAKLPSHTPKPSTKCFAAGWGVAFYNASLFEQQIRYGELYIIEDQDCKRFYPMKTEKEFCATNPSDIKVATCEGDSGGPLFCNGEFSGIISYSYPCGLINISEVYTNVYDYRDWIKAHINEASTIHYHFVALYISYMLYSTF